MRRSRAAVFLPFVVFAISAALPGAVARPPAQGSPTYQQFLNPASPLEVTAARKDGSHRLDILRGRQAQRLHSRRSFVHAATAHELPEGRRHRSLRHPDLGRWRDGGVRARHRAEPGRLVGEPVGRSEWTRALGLGGSHRGRRRVAGRRQRAGAGAGSRRQRGAVRARRPDPSCESVAGAAGDRRRSRREAVHSGCGVSSRARSGRRTAGRSPSSASRTDHSFIVVYDMVTRTVQYMSPSVDFDSSPLWTEDGQQRRVRRRPGLPFGQQAQQGGGGLGNPNGPAFQPNAAAGRGGRAAVVPALGDAPAGRGDGAQPPRPRPRGFQA